MGGSVAVVADSNFREKLSRLVPWGRRCRYDDNTTIMFARPSPLRQATSDSVATVTPRLKPLNVTVALGRVLDGVRDRIMEHVRRTYGDEPWAAPFLGHLAKVGRYAFDVYSELEFVLEQYPVRLIFKTIIEEDHVMTYRMPDMSLEPDPRLARRRGVLGWLLD
jgi:hypothetical protein